MSYWAVAQLETHRAALALYCLKLAGFETYLPRFRERRRMPTTNKRVEIATPLFPGYAFIAIELQWHTARWSPGVLSIIRAGDVPARVPDRIITDLRARERNGLIDLPERPGLQRGDQVRIVRGPMADRLAIYDGMKGSERVAVLLALLGSVQRVELALRDIARVTG
jgi:transcriptional antiterminator RfaH